VAVETIYDYPHYYDVLFGWDRTVEADFYHRMLDRYGIADTDPVLEVACGTGQIAIRLAQYGRRICGLDRSAGMLEYMRRAAHAARVEVDAICADMCEFGTHTKFAAAYNPMSSFRLLHEDAGVQAHLQCMAACLREGGIYVLDMTFEDSLVGTAMTTSEPWEMTRGAVTVRAGNDAVCVNDAGVESVLAWGEEAHLRPYTSAAFMELLRTTRLFVCESWHPETSRATGVSEFSLTPAARVTTGRAMVVLRKTREDPAAQR
jgi:SAM-dependent methyltransferase